jgi:general stress protein 26
VGGGSRRARLRFVVATALLGIGALLSPGSGGLALEPGPGRTQEVASAPSRAEKLRVAREIMERVRYCALVTVDAGGQPRTRTVLPFAPEADMTVWIATRPGTRKLEQIAGNARVTLYYTDPEAASYVSLMGVARIRDDAESKRRYRHPEVAAFWPEYPEGYTLIEVEPVWLEVLGPGVEADEETWRPQEVRFEP